MKQDCHRFRRLLAEVLDERAPLPDLGWHEHLFTCSDCRDLLSAEEALEHVLASLPEPRLPAGLARRVLLRLRRDGEEESLDPLDTLLAEDLPPQAPIGLPERVLHGLASRRERDLERAIPSEPTRDLDALLGLLPEPSVPPGLGARVLDALDPERRAVPASVRRGRLLSFRRAALPAAVAIAAIALLAIYLGGRGGRSPLTDGPEESVAQAQPTADPVEGSQGGGVTVPEVQEGPEPALAQADPEPAGDTHPEIESGAGGDPGTAPVDEPDPELLESLDLLENWDLLASGDLDLLLDDLDETEATLLESTFQETETHSDEG